MVTHDIPDLTDPGSMPLHDWFLIIYELIQLYGPTATLTLDAGYNNISAEVSYEEPIGILNSPTE